MLKRRILLLVVISVIIIGLDQWTKAWSISALKDQAPISYLGGHVLLTYAENTGAWGSMGSNLSDQWRFWILTVLPFVFLGGLTWYTLTSNELKPYMVVCYSLVISGGMGNLIDRAVHGYVVDFLWMGLPGSWFSTNIFNIADVSIMAGVISLFVLHFIFERSTSAKPQTETNSEQSQSKA
jgi:signal peptidase II